MIMELLRFNGAVERDPAIDAWMKAHAGELGAIAQQWFEVMRKCGDEVRELMHDGCPVACLGDAPFGYVNVFSSHVNVGFFHGASLPDPARLLQGTGKFMRHVKLKPGAATNAPALRRLIDAAYSDIKARVENGWLRETRDQFFPQRQHGPSPPKDRYDPPVLKRHSYGKATSAQSTGLLLSWRRQASISTPLFFRNFSISPRAHHTPKQCKFVTLQKIHSPENTPLPRRDL